MEKKIEENQVALTFVDFEKKKVHEVEKTCSQSLENRLTKSRKQVRERGGFSPRKQVREV